MFNSSHNSANFCYSKDTNSCTDLEAPVLDQHPHEHYGPAEKVITQIVLLAIFTNIIVALLRVTTIAVVVITMIIQTVRPMVFWWLLILAMGRSIMYQEPVKCNWHQYLTLINLYFFLLELLAFKTSKPK